MSPARFPEMLYDLDVTRLPSNLRPTTRECVHLVTHCHFRSRVQDGGHAVRSAICENPMMYADFVL